MCKSAHWLFKMIVSADPRGTHIVELLKLIQGLALKPIGRLMFSVITTVPFRSPVASTTNRPSLNWPGASFINTGNITLFSPTVFFLFSILISWYILLFYLVKAGTGSVSWVHPGWVTYNTNHTIIITLMKYVLGPSIFKLCMVLFI